VLIYSWTTGMFTDKVLPLLGAFRPEYLTESQRFL
jgi:hypothetical protein